MSRRPAKPRLQLAARVFGVCLAAIAAAAAAHAEMLVASRPGAMCVAPEALSRLTLPDGSDRAARPDAPADLQAIKQAGGCIDIPLGARMIVQSVRRHTSIVTFDANDGRGARTFIIPNVDVEPDAASHAVAAVPPAPNLATSQPPSMAGATLGAPAVPSPPASAAAPVTALAAPPSVTPPPATPFTLPLTRDYAALVVALLKQAPAQAADDQVVRWWTSYRYPQAWWQLQNQEFKLQPLLAQARTDLAATMQAATPLTLVVDAQARFGEYDFAHSRFPLVLGFNQLGLVMQPCCVDSTILPRSVTLALAGLDGIDSLPMPEAAAQALVETRTRFGGVDRQLALLLTVKLDPAGATKTAYGPWQASGTVQSVDVLSGLRNPELVYRFAAAELAEVNRARAQQALQAAALADNQRRQAEQARQAELAASQAAAAAQQAAFQRQQLLERRQQLVAELAQASLSVRLASFASPGDTVSAAPLDNLRAARTRTLLFGEPVGVTMLVQAEADGRDVPTTWPGHLAVIVPHDKLLASGRWYLVSGRLSVPPGENLPPARLQAEAVFACASPSCTDAADPGAIVQRKLAATSP